MLQLKKICKQYKTGDLVQAALDGVSLNLRDNEFVAVLGPSGSGKTTLLNLIGGLDRYDSGDLIINNISTKKYKDRDWDSYRNHTIGFVFQSYNLIPHQSILANVELALTISGVSRNERRQRAKAALEQVGLGDQLHKKPNQMSGGQMQRVAIARALINDPDILLADEPTGALDSETSVQVMELLKEVAKDRLVVMVTHNPELAEKYATRIVNLRDGKITDDSDPFDLSNETVGTPEHKNMGKASMSFLTSLSLSFNNLRTKKARTLLTSFAGSIGIIGIALILSLSTGVNQYIENIQKSTMTSYPVTIDAQSMDLSSMLAAGRESSSNELTHELDGVYSNNSDVELAASSSMSIKSNNLTSFKEYLEADDCEILQYVGSEGIHYSYDVQFGVYAYDPDGVLVNTDGVVIGKETGNSSGIMSSMMGGTMDDTSSGNFEEMLAGADGSLISSAVMESYDMLYGAWPENSREVVLVLDENNEISLTVLYELGLLPSAEYTELMEKLENGEEIRVETQNWSYADACGQSFYLIPACDYYTQNKDGTFTYAGNSESKVAQLLDNAYELKISGIIRPKEDAANASISGVVGYTSALSDEIISHTAESAVVKAQEASPDVNVLNGLTFSPADDETKAADAAAYLSSLSVSEKAELCRTIFGSDTVQGDNADMANRMAAMSDEELAATLDQLLEEGLDTDILLSIYDRYVSSGTYEENMSDFGVVSLDAPSSISIYADDFESKEAITDAIDAYNKTVVDEDRISYTDYVGMLMSSITMIVDVISYVLIAFVAVSLIVSSIMIGIITYISVLERTKEIGILRAVGASKRNISQVFNAETFIVGLCSGVIGIGITLLLLIPGNAVIHALIGSASVNASLPVGSAILLIVLSVVLTLIGGLIPSRKAAKKDPVTALRTE
jgi:ABC transporter, ATP-binding protein